MPAPDPKPPVAARRPLTTTLHGRTRSDDYAWLKDPDWQRVMREPEALDPDIRAYLEAENAYTDSFLAPYAALRETLYAEMRGRMKEDESSVPAPDGDWAYHVRYVEDGEHPLYCRAPRGDEAAEELLLDGNREAEASAYFRIGACRHSGDHRRLAYTLDLNGSERYRLFVRDIASGAVIDGPIEDAHGDVVWAADGETLFYTVIDENHRPWQVRRHRVGGDASADPVVYEESDPGFFVGLGKSESGRFVMISAHDHTTSEVRLIEAAAPEAPPRLVAARARGVEYSVAHRGGLLYILTNADGATDSKIVTAPVDAPGREAWREWLAHEAGTYVRTQLLFAGHHVRLERVGGLPRIVVTDLATGAAHALAFEEEAYDLFLRPGYEFETATLRFVYSSMTTPQQTFDYDMATRRRTLRKTQEVPSGHDRADYVTRRLTALSKDGAHVPVSLLHRRGTPLDGTAPLLLYGYGAYGHAMPAAFSTNRLSLVDRGFVYAIAHIRGGTDCGYGWYLDGKLTKKANTFADFIAAAEHLIAEGYTAKGRIAAHGGSAGGHAHGSGREHAARSFRRHRRRGALRRRAQHHVRRGPAADAAGVAGMGQSHRGRSGLAHHRVLCALRERRGQGLSRDLRDCGADRPARDLLGAGEMGGPAPPAQDRRHPAPAAHQHGGRPRRRLRPLSPAGRSGDGLCLRPRRRRPCLIGGAAADACTALEKIDEENPPPHPGPLRPQGRRGRIEPGRVVRPRAQARRSARSARPRAAPNGA